MPTIRTHLDRCQLILQDARTIGTDGMFWSRAELLAYFEDGYRHMVAEVSPTRRFTVLDVPPRFPCSVSQPWERDYVRDAPAWQWSTLTAGGWAVSSLWEIEVLEDVASVEVTIGQFSEDFDTGDFVTEDSVVAGVSSQVSTLSSGGVVTHPWERAFNRSIHQHFQFAVPRDTERVVKIWHNHRLLLPISTRSLDDTFTTWMSLQGLPVTWQLGIGPNRTFEVYAINTAYVANYRHIDAVTNDGNPLHGSARRFSGDRVYGWASDSGDTIPYGIPRRISSPDRQYYPRTLEPLDEPLGRATWLASSSDSLLVLEARIPDATTLTEQDEAVLLPPQMAKYLRYYTLFRAFNRQGEGYDGLMALFFEQRYQRGIAFLRRLHQLARKDRLDVRAPVTARKRRPPRVRLPSNYPVVIRQ
ncbi:MAG: hypothetical protein ACR2QC_11880 [Gammaproteobacteria bacterium]